MIATSYRYPVSRTGRTRFASRKHYLVKTLEARPEGGGGFTPKVCQAIEAVTHAGRSRPGDPWSRVPWLTVVVGSGCLDGGLGFSPASLAARVGAGVSDALRDVLAAGARLEAEELEEPTRAFTEDLVRGRMGLPVDDPAHPLPDDPADGAVEPTAVRLLALTSLLTRFFHSVRASGHVASARWDDDAAVLVHDHGELVYAIVEPALEILDHLIRELPDEQPIEGNENVLEAVCALLESIDRGLRAHPRQLKIDHLRVVTEVAWYFLSVSQHVSVYPVYPGWTELLLRLMLREGIQATSSSGRPRPRHTQITELPDAVVELLEPTTKQSWRERTNVANERETLYRGVAELLCAQADELELQLAALRNGTGDGRSLPPGAGRLPPAAAFVTSFDLELDMAMWQARRGRPFSVVVPVHVLRDDEAVRAAEFCWLMGMVEPVADGTQDEQLERLRHPTAWRLLTPQTNTEMLRRQPAVIHLSGCPLFTLPDLDDPSSDLLIEQLADVGIVVDRGESELAHAVTVDEYLALRQSEAELFWTSNGDAGSANRNRALHPSFTRDGSDNQRFWMALGVPMADPAVRNRVASQITLRWIRDSAHQARVPAAGEEFLGPDPSLPAEPPARPSQPDDDSHPYRADVDGVAINRYMSDDEVALLNWLGLDVVEAQCAEFASDLLHCAEHLRSDGGKRARLDRRCRID